MDLTTDFACRLPEAIYDNPDEYKIEKNHYSEHMYYNDPHDIGQIVGLYISLHEDSTVSSVRLEQTWDELGLDDFGKMDIIHSVELEFDYEFTEAEVERFLTVGDLVEHLSKSVYIH